MRLWRKVGISRKTKRACAGLPNHPVVNVTWYETLKYCEWLTKRLRAWKETPEPLAILLRQEGWRVTLPSEAEGEKAARGAEDGRIYPWGNEFDPNKANTAESWIGATSAMGCFPTGASPYGVMDLSGNVWEWTRSLWGTDYMKPEFRYPYDPTDQQRERIAAPDDVLRVLRGGAFWLNLWNARCAYRGWDLPDYRSVSLGFRVVVLP